MVIAPENCGLRLKKPTREAVDAHFSTSGSLQPRGKLRGRSSSKRLGDADMTPHTTLAEAGRTADPLQNLAET